MCLVHVPKSSNKPAAEGWIPGHVLGHTSGTLKIRKTIANPDSPVDCLDSTKKERATGPRSRRRLKKTNAKLNGGQSLGNLTNDSANKDVPNEERTSVGSAPHLQNGYLVRNS